jgi:hypothetical protein
MGEFDGLESDRMCLKNIIINSTFASTKKGSTDKAKYEELKMHSE